ncbi:MAG: hypothetical protein ACREDF_07110, partial [Thermoplasmata archaeon]
FEGSRANDEVPMRRALLTVSVTFSLSSGLAAGQAAPGAWTQLRTPWGDPDLRGVWDFRTLTPLERPAELSGKEVLSDEDAAEFERETLRALDKDRRTSDGLTAAEDVRNAYNQFWWDYGTKLTEDKRTSLIVDPPDGRVPPLTPEAQKRADARAAALQRPAHGPEDRTVWERCILGFNAGPPMNPGAYNNNVQIFQIPGYAVILTEMVHDARIVPLDGRPHLPGHIQQWRGDSRGHWEGDTLVVDTTNFTEKTSFRGTGGDLHLVERFTRVDAERLLYEYTIDDPKSLVKTWSAAIPMMKTEEPMFEYACHEGNLGMFHLLQGARAQEKSGTERR